MVQDIYPCTILNLYKDFSLTKRKNTHNLILLQQMNTEQIRIEDYLQRIGITPTKKVGNNLWYKSPFRAESNPSFKVNQDIKQWYDFGSGDNGNIIDLAMKLHKTDSVSEALRAIERCVPNIQLNSFSFGKQNSPEQITNIRLMPIASTSLIQLLNKRGISIELARLYCKEVHYSLKGKNYYAIAFPNDKGGYETLNPYFKGCLSPKEITTILNNIAIKESDDSVMHMSMNTCTQVYKKDVTHRHNNTSIVNLFEGFMDYLSLLTLQPSQASVSAVVLNSVNNLDKAIPFLSEHSKINSFLDNDDAGRLALKKLQSLKLPVEGISARYSNFKDVNDYLVSRLSHQRATKRKPNIGIKM